METGALRSQYFALLSETASSAAQVDDGQTEGWLQAELRRQLDLIAQPMQEDPSKPYTNDDHAAARAMLLDFPAARIAFVRCEVAKASSAPLPDGCQ
jgi:hypothetical protein